MKLPTTLRSAAAAVALAAAALPAAAQVYVLDTTDVAAYGPAPFGSVTLTQNGGDVDVKVDLRGDMNFLTTGGHNVFSFNGIGMSVGDITNIHDASTQTFTAVVPGTNPPFGSFDFGIVCATGCSPGGSAGGYPDPLTFTVQNANVADFLDLSSGGDHGKAYFAADVLLTSGPNAGATGAVGAVTAPVPEPETYALMLAGIGMMGFMARRRRPA
jgi:PEP-CTERM motif-containing protein